MRNHAILTLNWQRPQEAASVFSPLCRERSPAESRSLWPGHFWGSQTTWGEKPVKDLVQHRPTTFLCSSLFIFKACTRYLCINRIHDRVLQELHHDEPLQPLKVLPVGLIHSLQLHNNKMNVPSISPMACVLFFYSGHTPTFSWLTSARKRLCILYRSSFRGSCQYCACTKLTGTNAASDKADRTDRNSELFRGRKSNQGHWGTKRTASEPSPCKLQSWGLCVSCCTRRSSRQDTWAGRTPLGAEEHTNDK